MDDELDYKLEILADVLLKMLDVIEDIDLRTNCNCSRIEHIKNLLESIHEKI